jgi:hypothetical protein
MSTFNFAEAIKTAKTEDEFWKLAVKHGVSITPPSPPSYSSYAFVNLGELEGHDAFIAKGVLGRFNACNYGDAFAYYEIEYIEKIALTALFKAQKAFQKFDESCINVSKPSNLTFSSFFNLLWKNMSEDCFWIGSYTRVRRFQRLLRNSICPLMRLLFGVAWTLVSQHQVVGMTSWLKMKEQRNIFARTTPRVS